MDNNFTAFVLGANGFLGRHLSKNLKNQNWKIIGLGHGEWLPNEEEYWGLDEWHCGDVTLENLCRIGCSPDAIFHCAGTSTVKNNLNSQLIDFDRTVGSTINALEFIKTESPASKFLFVSSAAVYGSIDKLPIVETAELKPISRYGFNKLFAEEIIQSYCLEYGLSASIVRLFSVYGAGLKKQLIWDACQKFAQNIHDFNGSGKETRDWIHVTDATNLLATAINFASEHCPVYNGGSGISIPNSILLDKLAKLLDSRQSLRFNGETRLGDPLHYQADISNARSIGWTPEVDLNTGIQEYITWYRSDHR